MNRPRIPLGLESSRATLNPEVCARLGRDLGAGRRAQALDVGDVARRLLLSPTQVKGLEAADPEAFYSAELYLVAARKYDALLGLGSTLIDDVLARPDTGGRVGVAPDPVRVPTSLFRTMPVHLLLAASMTVALTAAGGWWLLFRGSPMVDDTAAVAAASAPPTLRHLVSTTLPSTPVEVRLSPPANRRTGGANRAAAGGETPALHPDANASDEFGHIRVQRATWVFVRYQDNSTVERVLSPGERLVLHGMPIYLAAGTAPGAEVVLVGQPIDTERFNVNGQLRIGSAFLSAAARQ